MKGIHEKKFNLCRVITSLCLTVLLIMTFACLITPKTTKDDFSYAAKSRDVSEYSIFMHNPTYSTFYNSKVFFVDEYDMYLKIYDTAKPGFLNEYIPLSGYGEIVDATCLKNYFFFLTNGETTSKIVAINLDNLEVEVISNDKLNSLYSKLAVTEIKYLDENKFAFSLTPVEISETSKPLIIFANQTTLEIGEDIFEFSIKDSSVNTSIFKFFTLNSTIDENHLHLVYFYGSSVGYTTLTFDNLSADTPMNITLFNGGHTDNIATSIFISNINILKVNNISYFLVTYKNDARAINQSYSRLYTYNIEISNQDSHFTYFDEIEAENNNYTITSDCYVIYPNANKNIIYSEIETEPFAQTKFTVSNPEVIVDYFLEDEFVYYSVSENTQRKTYLLASPWDEVSQTEILPNTDIICIGKGIIKDTNAPVTDFLYCLYTTQGENKKGYIFTDNLTKKPEITGDEEEYRTFMNEFRVVNNTPLYSLPTKVIDNDIIGELDSKIIMQIKDTSLVTLESFVYGYTNNNGTFIKVLVDEETYGYIDIDQIVDPTEFAEFVDVNAKIKKDGTKVYYEANNKTFFYTLDKGYLIRIDGAKNTENGYTKITFTDEWGYTMTGYVMTDLIASDNWSTLQIIGCILIAINTGLLILIIKFKNDRIGKRGQKYDKNKKANYNEQKALSEENKKMS